MKFLLEEWSLSLLAIFAFVSIFVATRYRLPPSKEPENMWQQANRFQEHFPGLKGTAIKYFIRLTLVAWPIAAVVGLYVVSKGRF